MFKTSRDKLVQEAGGGGLPRKRQIIEIDEKNMRYENDYNYISIFRKAWPFFFRVLPS